MKYKPLFLTTFVMSVLFSCSPEIKHPDLKVEFPEKWLDSTQTYAYIDSAWWEGFGDEKLDSVIATAFEHNYSLQAAAARMEAAEAQATIAGADLYPSISISGSGVRQKRSLVGFPSNPNFSLPEHLNTFGTSANVAWELDLWGRVRNARSAAGASFEASKADYDGFKLSLAAQTIKAWFAAIDASKQLELSQSNFESYQLSQERILARYEKGLRPSLDYRFSRSSVAAAESQMYQRIQQSDQSKRQVEFILGKYPAAKIELSKKLPMEIGDIPEGIPADLLQRRPDIIAAERRLAASQCNVSAAKAALFPSIRLTGSYGTSTDDLSEILNMDFSVWSIAANVLQPVFQGGKLRANVKLNEALQKQAFAAYANTVLLAYSEVELILAADQFLRKQEAATKISRDEAVAAKELSEDRYYKGLVDIITFLDASRQANNAESQLLTIRRLRLENRVDFYVALGGEAN
ncbi:MAG: efflux transporter outer membrane subunit [Calditrichaeota bacterium]|nr:efflux transporter outer membrane subunit [Calditrichota bacterium]